MTLRHRAGPRIAPLLLVLALAAGLIAPTPAYAAHYPAPITDFERVDWDAVPGR